MNAPRQWTFRHTATREKDTLWEEQKRLKNPDIVPVDLSDKLSAMKLKLIEAADRWFKKYKKKSNENAVRKRKSRMAFFVLFWDFLHNL